MRDILISTTGDLVPNWTGGLSEGTGVVIDYQDINWRALSNDPDQPRWQLGANLDDLIGLPNSQATARIGEQNLSRCLTFDKRFLTTELRVVGIPIAVDQIQFFVTLLQASKFRTTAPFYTATISLTG